MPTLRRAMLPPVVCLLAGLAAQAQAAGIGEGSAGAVLGQPLDYTVQVRADPGEVLGPECVSAEVTAGDRKLPAPLVRTVIERGNGEALRVRVQTTQGIDEPVIGVLLNVGCSNRVSRRFVVLADPPGSAQSPTMAAVPLVQPGFVTSPGAAGAADTSRAPAVARALPNVPREAGEAPRPAARDAAREQPRERPQPRPGAAAGAEVAAAAPAPRAAAARQPPAPPAPPAERRPQPPATAAAAPAATAAERLARTDAAPRLRLDMLEPGTSANQAIEQALEAVAQAASATRAANAAAQAAEQRIASLERTVEQLRSEARQSRAEAGEMRERLRKSEAASPWLWPLVLGVLLLGGLAAWLARELAVLRRAQQRTWQQGLRQAQAEQQQADRAAEVNAASRTPTSPIPFVTSEIVPPQLASPRNGMPPGRAWPPPAPPEPPRTVLGLDTQPPPQEPPAVAPLSAQERALHRTLPLPHLGYAAEAGSSRDVSIEELIDLEQQAEFFVVLGQDEAAVDLLVEHLRSTGGSSPLPYLKLLEIHHRRGDKAAYERTRQRFNQRFNAYAPEWDIGLQHGRALEDYAGVIPRLQQVWPRPLDAMAELEALLFRKSRGDLFDLPAYRDVLFLYSLARDLLDREAASTGDVDLLLPLADGGHFGSTTPHPYLGLERDSVFDSSVNDDAPTSPVDLDLSGSERSGARIFDPLDSGSRVKP